MSVLRVTTPRVDSSEASRRTLKRRSDEIGTIRDLVSKGASADQLQHEIKALTKEEREVLLDQAMVRAATINIPDEEILAFKSDLCFPWSKLRMLKRYTLL